NREQDVAPHVNSPPSARATARPRGLDRSDDRLHRESKPGTDWEEYRNARERFLALLAFQTAHHHLKGPGLIDAVDAPPPDLDPDPKPEQPPPDGASLGPAGSTGHSADASRGGRHEGARDA